MRAGLSLLVLAGVLGYADRAGTDIVMDAPWRSVRDYVPVLFFFPQFEGGRRVERIRVLECSNGVAVGPAVVVDAVNGPDTLHGATFVGPLGESRGGLGADERVSNFWHYVVRVPHEALSHHVGPQTHELRAEVEWTRAGFFGSTRFVNQRTLRVVVDPRQFPSFAGSDRWFDTHAHTIAELTTSGVLDVNGGSKAYGGPVIMLLEAAYALGLVQTQPGDGNWSAYRDSIVVTDHNMFYSREPYDTGVAPRFGPTAATDGHAGEAAWYRAQLGRLAGEEITLRRGSNQDDSARPNLGHHLLAYGARHFEGPWHGGQVLTSLLENPNTLESVLATIKAAGATGFVYASHPNLDGFVWPPEYFAQGIGLPPYDSRSGPGVDSTRGEFLYKGSEVWNTKLDQVARDSGRLPASSAFDKLDPFPGGPPSQRFHPVVWDGELARSLETYFGQLRRTLSYSFREAPQEKFIRKLYMSAGSDAHGDFDYSDEVSATAVPWSGLLHSNAWARVRTYALAHDRAAGERDAVQAFADGNTVISDGPLVLPELDADARHDPSAGVARWHDGRTVWQNADGRIGGEGRFDGARTMLVPSPGADVWMRTRWLRSATPEAGDLVSLRIDRIMRAGRDSFHVALGAEAASDMRRIVQPMDSLAALVASARDPATGERCITNPVWVVPVRIDLHVRPATPGGSSPVACLARELRVVFEFPVAMTPAPGTRAFVRPLDSQGNSTEPEIELVPDPGWEAANGVSTARYSATNAANIAMPAGDWDANTHAHVPGSKSFVVYLKAPTELHGSVLNDIGRSFALPVAR